MEELSGLDASFLFLESDKTPMHIGGIALIEGTIRFEDFRQYIQQRLPLVDRLTQKLLSAQLGLDRPHWVQDPDFDLNMHLFRTALPSPGGWKELRCHVTQEFSKPLNREHPLWEFIFVEGLDNIPQVPKGSVALLSKVHHAGFDGKSGIELLSMLYDTSADIAYIAPTKPKALEAIPAWFELLAGGAANLLLRPAKLPLLLWDSAKAGLKATYLRQVKDIKLPTLPFTSPHTCLNDTVSSERNWDSALLDLDRVKALRTGVEGATLNDVILAICAGALRRYLSEKKQLPEESLVAMVPISTRVNGQQNTMGNQISAMFIQLATNIEDPIERLRTININTLVGKLYQEVVAAKGLMDYAELVPFALAGVATHLYSQAILTKRIKPPFNLIITNVPGPQVPLYLAGHKLLFNMGTGPIYDGAGLIIPVLSYNGTLSISPTSCAKLMPEIELFTRYIHESVNELEIAVDAKVKRA
jgi:WS/DGAT/MGAT family acyltransferase